MWSLSQIPVCRLISGVGTQCCYDTAGDLMVDQFNGGSIDKSAPVDYISSIMHIQDDLLPYIFCCTAMFCNRYYENRPSINDAGWNPPIPGEEMFCIYLYTELLAINSRQWCYFSNVHANFATDVARCRHGENVSKVL